MAKLERLLFAALIPCSFACGPDQQGSRNMPIGSSRPEVHGHRGCRGLLPENTVAAFLKATDLGCDFLELDVVVNADGEVVVSHEPWMDHRICLDKNGDTIPAAQERSLNIYRMTGAEVQQCDCGSLQHPDFPSQESRSAHKPLLAEVVEAVREHARSNGKPEPRFNVEIKSEPEHYGSHQPQPTAFASLVAAELQRLGIDSTCIVQSFDPFVLNAIWPLNAGLTIALLVDNTESLDTNLARLTFTPDIYSPNYRLADERLVAALRTKGIGIAVWTVNEEADMKKMMALGVDGIITDYPDRLIGLLDKQ